jgi:hypothetical protein
LHVIVDLSDSIRSHGPTEQSIDHSSITIVSVSQVLDIDIISCDQHHNHSGCEQCLCEHDSIERSIQSNESVVDSGMYRFVQASVEPNLHSILFEDILQVHVSISIVAESFGDVDHEFHHSTIGSNSSSEQIMFLLFVQVSTGCSINSGC